MLYFSSKKEWQTYQRKLNLEKYNISSQSVSNPRALVCTLYIDMDYEYWDTSFLMSLPIHTREYDNGQNMLFHYKIHMKPLLSNFAIMLKALKIVIFTKPTIFSAHCPHLWWTTDTLLNNYQQVDNLLNWSYFLQSLCGNTLCLTTHLTSSIHLTLHYMCLEHSVVFNTLSKSYPLKPQILDSNVMLVIEITSSQTGHDRQFIIHILYR